MTSKDRVHVNLFLLQDCMMYHAMLANTGDKHSISAANESHNTCQFLLVIAVSSTLIITVTCRVLPHSSAYPWTLAA